MPQLTYLSGATVMVFVFALTGGTIRLAQILKEDIGYDLVQVLVMASGMVLQAIVAVTLQFHRLISHSHRRRFLVAVTATATMSLLVFFLTSCCLQGFTFPRSICQHLMPSVHVVFQRLAELLAYVLYASCASCVLLELWPKRRNEWRVS